METIVQESRNITQEIEKNSAMKNENLQKELQNSIIQSKSTEENLVKENQKLSEQLS
jgi:hypothetical protein